MEHSAHMKLIIKYLSGSINEKEKTELNNWLESDKKNKKLFTALKQAWNSQEKNDETIDVKMAWNRLSQKAGIALSFEGYQLNTGTLHSRSKKTYSKHGAQILRYAAVLLIAASVVFIFKNTRQEVPAPVQQEVIVQFGNQSNVVLPDGSKVILDAGSKLTFPKNFEGSTRQVHLYGEAYFEVSHNTTKPFIIYANKGIITVVGTKFNIRAWKFENDEVKVVVTEGKVSLCANTTNKEDAVIINKGRMSYLTDSSLKASIPQKVNIETHLAWMQRDLILENTPLDEVLDRLSRWYNLQFELPSPVYNKVKVTGTFKKKSVDHILEAIGLMIHLDYKRNRNKIRFFQS